MPYVFITTTFPTHKTNEAGKLFVDTLQDYRKAQRPLSKEIVSNAIKSTDDGIEAIGVHDIKEGKLEEFLLLQAKTMTQYHSLEGLKYRIEVRFKVTEALEMIGMKAPE